MCYVLAGGIAVVGDERDPGIQPCTLDLGLSTFFLDQPSRGTFADEEVCRHQHWQSVELTTDDGIEVPAVQRQQDVGPSESGEENRAVLARGKDSRTVQAEHIIDNPQLRAASADVFLPPCAGIFLLRAAKQQGRK